MRKGVFLLMAGEFCFASATVFAKLITKSSEIPAIEITFFRFLIGIFLAWGMLRRTGASFVPVRKKFVIWRGILNTIAVLLFFTSVKYTTITNSNMLNMTYPIFIYLFIPLYGTEKIRPILLFYLLVSIVGIYMIIQPNFNHLLYGDLIGLLSGIVGGASVLALRRARETDSTPLILFYLFCMGTVINGVLLIPSFVKPSTINWIYILISAIIGVLGQIFMTSGYKYIEAAKGSLVSSSRILFALLLGVTFFSERLNTELIIGAALIIYSIISLQLPRKVLQVRRK